MGRRPPKRVSRTIAAPPARVGVRAPMAIVVTGQRILRPDALTPASDLTPSDTLTPAGG